MPLWYDDVFSAIEEHTFTIPNVDVRKPFDESAKSTYPMIVVHKILDAPGPYGTVNGETRTYFAIQLDILTRNCKDSEDVVLSRWDAGERLWREVTTLLDDEFKMTRRGGARPQPVSSDVLQHTWRGDAVLDAEGYTYRP